MFFVYVCILIITNCSSSQPIVQALVLLLLILAFQGHPTRLPFLELCFQILLARYCDYCLKKSSEIFRIKTKGPLESLMNGQRLHVLELSTAPISGQLTVSDATKTFETTNESWKRMPSKIDIKCLITCTLQFLVSRRMDRKAYYSNSSEKGRQYI